MPLFSRKHTLPDLEGKTLDELLFLSDTAEDPRMKYHALSQAERLEPDNLETQRRLLLHGRLHERDPRRVDFSVIKCRLLHGFEHPEQHPEGEARAMARELFDDARLRRCLELAKDGDNFLQGYLEDLSRDYMRIFVASDNTHIPRVFGVSFKGSLHRYLAVPARDVISNILSSPYLKEEEARVLARAFYRAYFEHARGETRELDTLLGAEIRAQLK